MSLNVIRIAVCTLTLVVFKPQSSIAQDQNVTSARASAAAGGGAKQAQGLGNPPAAATPHLPDDRISGLTRVGLTLAAIRKASDPR